MTFNRPFWVVEFINSHSQLLIRGPRLDRHEHNVDLIFTGVSYMELFMVFDPLEITFADSQRPDLLARFRQYPNSAPIRTVRLRCRGHDCFVLCTSVSVEHNQLEHNESSLDMSRINQRQGLDPFWGRDLSPRAAARNLPLEQDGSLQDLAASYGLGSPDPAIRRLARDVFERLMVPRGYARRLELRIAPGLTGPHRPGVATLEVRNTGRVVLAEPGVDVADLSALLTTWIKEGAEAGVDFTYPRGAALEDATVWLRRDKYGWLLGGCNPVMDDPVLIPLGAIEHAAESLAQQVADLRGESVTGP